MTQERRLAVLRAIVQDYADTYEPVGSKTLAERHNLGVSPATIRNDMAQLEEEGLIHQPHTSAGRVPTDKGYRAFVDAIEHIKPLSAAEKRAIGTLIHEPVDLDEVVEQTVRGLAQLTNQLALVQYPSATSDHIRHLEVVHMTDTRSLLVVITSSGRVEQHHVITTNPYTPDDVADVHQAIKAHVETLEIPAALTALDNLPTHIKPEHQNLADHMTQALREALGDGLEQRIVVAGTNHLARGTNDVAALTPILDLLEEQVVLLQLLSDMADDPAMGVSVQIGHENHHTGLAGASVVSSGYAAGDASARLAVLGPTHMDYRATIAGVRAVARYVSRIIAS